MHPIAMPSSPVFLTVSSFIASPTPCCPFFPLTPAKVIVQIDAVSRCDDFGSYVPFGLLQSDNVTTLCSTESQQGLNVVNTVNAVDRYCTNVERAERKLA